MAILWPAVVDYLVTTIDGLLPDVAVFDGLPVTNSNPKNYIAVGHVTDDNAGTFAQSDGGDSNWVYEDGTVRSQLVCNTGTDDALPLVRGRAAGYISTLDVHFRSDKTLGGILTADATVLFSAEAQSVKADGTAQVFVITLTYTSRAY